MILFDDLRTPQLAGRATILNNGFQRAISSIVHAHTAPPPGPSSDHLHGVRRAKPSPTVDDSDDLGSLSSEHLEDLCHDGNPGLGGCSGNAEAVRCRFEGGNGWVILEAAAVKRAERIREKLLR